MECIEHDLAGGVGDSVNHFDGLRRQINEAGLKAIEWFKAQNYAMITGIFRQRTELRYEQISVPCPFFSSRLPGAPYSRIDGTNQIGRAQFLSGENRSSNIVHSILSNAFVRVNQIPIV